MKKMCKIKWEIPGVIILSRENLASMGASCGDGSGPSHMCIQGIEEGAGHTCICGSPNALGTCLSGPGVCSCIDGSGEERP
ncbi:MAG: hypothetical protein HQ564_09680 [Candidatus Saganbacteria bacterium]|nr:hypothetical protein [Candidatus Saganbacteria bacterium]